MNEKKKTPDRRVRKTKKALRESLTALLAEKNIRDISVQELADLADLNRATFYLHYKDVYELQQQIEDDVVGEINAILDQHMPAASDKEPYSLFVTLISYLQENADLCGMLLSDNSGGSFLSKLCAIVEERCLSNWLQNRRMAGAREELSYFSSYTVYGYVAALIRWVRTGMTLPPERLAQMLGNIGLYGIGFLDHIEDCIT